MMLETMTRAEMECEILAEGILPTDTAEDLAKVSAMSDEELRAAIQTWIENGSEV